MPEEIKGYLTKLINLIFEPITKIKDIQFAQENCQYRIILETENQELFLGDNCDLLRSIQHIIRVAVHNQFPKDRTHFVFDIGGYNKHREHIISVQIPRLAQQKVLAEGKSIILINLTGYERLQVHNLLLDVKGVETTSVGNGKNRKLLIIPTSDLGAMSLEESIIFDLNTIQK
jgi:predicted RNA-binding protein Jag